MRQDTFFTRLRENITTIVGLIFTSMLIIGLFTEFWLLIAGFVGVFVLTPLVALLFGDRDAIEEWWGEEKAERYATESRENPIETLKHRYAEGELSEEEFEQRLQQLLEADHSETTHPRSGQSTNITDEQTENISEFELEDR